MVQTAVNLATICILIIYAPLDLSAPATEFLDIYPPMSLVMGVAFCAHGTYSGRWIILGAVYFPLALLLAALPFWSPLIMGVVGAITIAIADWDIRRSIQQST